MQGPTEYRLKCHAIEKAYSAVVLNRVDLEVCAGEVHGLLGANGAGKSTLCKIIAGLQSSDAGHMALNGNAFNPRSKKQAEQAGVQIVQQELNQIATLSVAENLTLGEFPRRGWRIDFAKMYEIAADALQRVGLRGIDPRIPIGSIGIGKRQLIEIASALIRPCELLILDEPTAALTASEIEILFANLESLKSRGCSVIYVSHRLDEVLSICDTISVLRDGQRIATKPVSQLNQLQLVELMSGEDQKVGGEFTSARTNQTALRVENLNREKVLFNLSYDVHRGERLGIWGLVGSGRTELLRAIFGADRQVTGTVQVEGKARIILPNTPKKAVSNGIALVTEDRKQDGLLLPLSIRANSSLATLGKALSKLGIVNRVKEVASVESVIERLDTRYRDLEQPVSQLSGGNQQKVLLGRWLQVDPTVLLLDEPTRGVDASARKKIFALLDQLAQDGKSLVIVSSDLSELMEHCDSILVISAGQIVDRFERAEFSRERLMASAFKGYLTQSVDAENAA